MTRTAKLQMIALGLGIAAISACSGSGGGDGSPSPVASVNESFVLDAEKATAGAKVYRDKACFVCHNLGEDGRAAAPDLAGLVERRDLDWIRKFLLNTEEMLATDPIAMAMLEAHNFAKMPNMRLTEQQTENLIHYIHKKTLDKRGA